MDGGHTCRVRSRDACEAPGRTLNEQPPRVRSHRSDLLERLLADVCNVAALRNRSITRDRHVDHQVRRQSISTPRDGRRSR
jgi:hypothetical protein